MLAVNPVEDPGGSRNDCDLDFKPTVNALALLKAEYLFRPGQALRRVLAGRRNGEFTEAVLPWGAPIRVRTNEAIGRIVLALGVFDLPVTETLLRLADPGEVVADVGANLGCMTAALAQAVDSGGVIWSFEPHPELFEELRSNALRWTGPRIELQQVALSNKAGRIAFESPAGFDENRGLARVVSSALPTPGRQLEVEATTLDAVFSQRTPPAVIKIDVEGHELAVFEGGADLFKSGHVRDCIFEEHGAYPTGATRFLEDRGYSLFTIGRALTRPVLRPPAAVRSTWESTSYLATLDAVRAHARLSAHGWRALGRVGLQRRK
jgi:FkbM family methyltransferase